MGQHIPHWNSVFTEIQRQRIIPAPTCLCSGKMWKIKEYFFISFPKLPWQSEVLPCTWYSSFVFVQSLNSSTKSNSSIDPKLKIFQTTNTCFIFIINTLAHNSQHCSLEDACVLLIRIPLGVTCYSTPCPAPVETIRSLLNTSQSYPAK